MFLAFLVFVSSAPNVYAKAPASEDEDSMLAPYFIVESNDSSVDRFPLKGTDVTVSINGMIAEIFVNQTYTNEGEVPITELTCKSHEINIVKSGEASAQVTLSNPEDYAGNRDFILKYRLTGEDIQSGLVLTKGNEENYFMLTVQPPERFEPEEITRREYIFVLDVSGSMNGYPLDTAKVLIRDLVSNLREEDTFNLILFSGASVQMSRESVPATGENIQKALNLINKQEGYGGTSLSPALQDAIATADRFRTYIQSPLLTDIQITYDGFDVYDAEPSVPSTMFAQKPIVLFGKWKGEPKGTITITGKKGKEDYIQEIKAEDVTAYEKGDAIRYLWARMRLERLMDYGYSKDDPSVKEEVTQIGLDYGIMTPYTSFVAVVEEIRNPEGESTDVNQPLPMPLQVSNLSVGGGYRAYSEPWEIALIAAFIGAMLIGGMRHRKRRGKIV